MALKNKFMIEPTIRNMLRIYMYAMHIIKKIIELERTDFYIFFFIFNFI